MKTIVKSQSLDMNIEDFEIMTSDLEKLNTIEPNKNIIEYSQRMNWSIDQKDIVIKNKNSGFFYEVQFYHNAINENNKKCYLGSDYYHSPIEISK